MDTARYSSVSYVIEGPEMILGYINGVINKYMQNNGNTWLGGMLYDLGAVKGDPQVVCPRSYLNSIEVDLSESPVTLRLETEEMYGKSEFMHCLAEEFKGIKIYYREVMRECGILKTNDKEGKYFPKQYRVDYKVGDKIGTEYVKTEDEALDIAYKLTGIAFSELLEVDCWNNDQEYDKGTDDYIYINEFLISD
jgi:hypothetical protein|nr:MAG TPA: hypothetical protein [Crassvirales sp.]